MLLVPLLPEEAEGLAAGGEVREPLLDPLDEKIARLVVQGKSLAEVARATSVGERTVDRRIRRMRSRYGLDSRAAFLEFFSRLDP